MRRIFQAQITRVTLIALKKTGVFVFPHTNSSAEVTINRIEIESPQRYDPMNIEENA
ncbi:MAG: hypothetical protein AB1546_03805 [bacterium]